MLKTMSAIAIISILILIGLAIFMLFRVFRKPQININDFKSRWRAILMEDVDYYVNLMAEERTRFERDILIFFSKVRITGVDTKINDRDRIFVACSAVIPLFVI